MPRKTTGTLYLRNGTYQLHFRFKGKQYKHSLKTDDPELASQRAEKYLEPFKLRQSADEMTAHADDILAAAGARQHKAAAMEDERRPRLTVADAWKAFEHARNRRQCGELTLQDYRNRWHHFERWAATAGRETMEAVTVADAEAFTASLDDAKLSANRRNKIVQTCRYVFNALSRQCANMPNPFGATSKAGIKNRAQRTTSRRPLSEAELLDVCDKATGELRTLLAIGIYTGLRLHDAACLQWEAINLELNRLVVTPHKTRDRSGKTIVIPMHPTLRRILEDTPREARRDDVLPEIAATYRRDVAALSKRIRRHFEACKINTQSTRPDQKDDEKPTKGADGNVRSLVSFHSLRHSFVTLAAKAGIPLAVVREIVGHGSPEIQRAYLHFSEADTLGAVMAMPDISREKQLTEGSSPKTADQKLAAIRDMIAAKARKSEQDKAILLIIG